MFSTLLSSIWLNCTALRSLSHSNSIFYGVSSLTNFQFSFSIVFVCKLLSFSGYSLLFFSFAQTFQAKDNRTLQTTSLIRIEIKEAARFAIAHLQAVPAGIRTLNTRSFKVAYANLDVTFRLDLLNASLAVTLSLVQVISGTNHIQGALDITCDSNLDAKISSSQNSSLLVCHKMSNSTTHRICSKN